MAQMEYKNLIQPCAMRQGGYEKYANGYNVNADIKMLIDRQFSQ